MKPKDIFQQLLNTISLFLKPYCYSRKGNAFYCQHGGNWGVIEFQKSRKSSDTEIIFTINFGVCSQNLLKFFKPEMVDKKTSIEECHWRQRIGLLLRDHTDKWWSINSNSSIEQLSVEIQEMLLVTGIPEIERYISDSELQALWLSNQSPGLTDVQRLINLSVLLKASGDVAQLNTVLQQLDDLSENNMASSMIKYHLGRIKGELL